VAAAIGAGRDDADPVSPGPQHLMQCPQARRVYAVVIAEEDVKAAAFVGKRRGRGATAHHEGRRERQGSQHVLYSDHGRNVATPHTPRLPS